MLHVCLRASHNISLTDELFVSIFQGLNIQSLQKRPSIAPVPATLETNSIHINVMASDSDDEEEEEVNIDGDDFPE